MSSCLARHTLVLGRRYTIPADDYFSAPTLYKGAVLAGNYDNHLCVLYDSAVAPPLQLRGPRLNQLLRGVQFRALWCACTRVRATTATTMSLARSLTR